MYYPDEPDLTIGGHTEPRQWAFGPWVQAISVILKPQTCVAWRLMYEGGTISSANSIREFVTRYYSERIATHGDTPQGVDWPSAQSQERRFTQLIKVIEGNNRFSIIDYGCGYGALLEFLKKDWPGCLYTGFDWSQTMIDHAKQRYADCDGAQFIQGAAINSEADYTVASGLFNVKLDVTPQLWQQYVVETLHKINDTCKYGFSFNILTKYSDCELMRKDLFYADPCFFFDYCKMNFAKNVALLHDYDLYEFTVLVKKQHRS